MGLLIPNSEVTLSLDRVLSTKCWFDRNTFELILDGGLREPNNKSINLLLPSGVFGLDVLTNSIIQAVNMTMCRVFIARFGHSKNKFEFGLNHRQNLERFLPRILKALGTRCSFA